MSDPNDLQAFLDGAWQHLSRGVANSRAPARYPTFATVSPNGKPEARTVVLRGAIRSTAVVEVHTDRATAKIAALRQNPFAALHVWIPKADLQIRLTACVEILAGADVGNQWAKVPPASRISYGTLPEPGAPIESVFAYEKPADPDRFAVLRCHLKEIDLVHLGTRHRRALFVSQNAWVGQWLAP